jgi:hypothetical protein
MIFLRKLRSFKFAELIQFKNTFFLGGGGDFLFAFLYVCFKNKLLYRQNF